MAPPAGWPHTQFLAGRLVATYDRGTVNYVGYDGRARLVEHAKRVAKPSATEGFADRSGVKDNRTTSRANRQQEGSWPSGHP